jgi:hypothetical protein
MVYCIFYFYLKLTLCGTIAKLRPKTKKKNIDGIIFNFSVMLVELPSTFKTNN